MSRSVRRKRTRRAVAAAAGVTAAFTLAACVPPDPGPVDPEPTEVAPFQHVGTFDVRLNGNEVSEIVDATVDGNTLLYTDSATGSIGVIDATDPANPLPGGRIDVGGSPTSVSIVGGYALVGVDLTSDFTAPAGELKVIRLSDRSIVRTVDLSGQPDSIAVAPAGDRAVVVIENQRDEDLNDGLIPQAPAGKLVVVDLDGDVDTWATRTVDLTGIAEVAPQDPEPEFVDINANGTAVVTLQENNHIAVVDLATGQVTSHFSAGSATATQVDAVEEEIGPDEKGDIQLVDTVTARREPDAVAWIDADSFATANEGDYTDADGVTGGSRGFTVFHVDGTVEHEAGSSFEHEQVRLGHHNEGRAANKGGEPESTEFGRFGEQGLLFVGAERANVVGVYDVTSGEPEFVQALPTGIGPEGLKAIPDRDLLVVASETSEGAIPSLVTIYEQDAPGAAPAYPGLASADDTAGAPVPFVAQSGLAGDPTDADTLYSVSDSILGVGYVYEIDNSAAPAVITKRIPVTGASFSLDLEGVAAAGDGGFWLASEGAPGKRPDAVLRTDAAGQVIAEHFLPASLTAGATSSGFEGLAVSADGASIYTVIQRPWADDAAGTTKIGRLDIATGEWTFVNYALDAVASPAGGWVGLSEITLLPDGSVAIIERDNQLGEDARIKRVYGVELADVDFRSHGESLVTVPKVLLRDVLGDLADAGVLTPDKLEGLAVDADGDVFVVTDNDGLDDALGQTLFLGLGPAAQLGGDDQVG